MQNSKKKPIMINLVAALIACFVTFVIGFASSSVFLLDSRLENAQATISELNTKLDEKDDKIKELNKTIDQKDKNNVILGEKVQEHLKTIERLSANVATLQHDVDYISETALNGTGVGGSVFAMFANLPTLSQIVLLLLLLVILVLIISVTCSIISKTSQPSLPRERRIRTERTRKVIENETSASTEEDSEEYIPPVEKAHGEISEGKVMDAINLLYHNNLEDSISDLGGFRFGITNFDEILSDKAKGKSFGNSENGDFVAFMSGTSEDRKLYIIPRYMTLSDSTVALRGVTDLFTVTNEAGMQLDHGTVKIKSVDYPAVFSCGEYGWSIESKGEITALGTK